MQNNPRKTLSRIAHLEQRHNQLKQEVSDLDNLRHLSAEQQMRVATLKKEKLAAKDELAVLRG